MATRNKDSEVGVKKHVINTSAPAYPRLADLFDHPEAEHIVWHYTGRSTIIATLKTSTGETLAETFDYDEINAVCPWIFEHVSNKGNVPQYNAYWSTPQTHLLWKHYRGNGLYVDAQTNCSIYARELLSIEAIPNHGDTVWAGIVGYGIRFKELNPLRKLLKHITKVSASSSKIIGIWPIKQDITQPGFKPYKISLDVLEESRPGFSSRLQVGVDLGLDKVELAKIAMGSLNTCGENLVAIVLPSVI